MDAAAWTVVGAAIAILAAIATAFQSLRSEMRMFRKHVDNRIDAQGAELRDRIDAQGKQLRDQIDTQGTELRDHIDIQGTKLRDRIDAQGENLRQRIDDQSKETDEKVSQLRERIAKLEGSVSMYPSL